MKLVDFFNLLECKDLNVSNIRSDILPSVKAVGFKKYYYLLQINIIHVKEE